MKLSDIPPGAKGIPWEKWIMLQITRQFGEYKAAQEPEPEPWVSQQRLANPRDNYGWRSLPTGSGLLPMNYEKKKRTVAPD